MPEATGFALDVVVVSGYGYMLVTTGTEDVVDEDEDDVEEAVGEERTDEKVDVLFVAVVALTTVL